MIAAAQLVHGVDEHPTARGTRVLQSSVAEVDELSRAMTERREHVMYFSTDALRRAEQDPRIEIALRCHALADACTRGPDVDGPVEPDRVSADRRDVLDPGSAAFGEN